MEHVKEGDRVLYIWGGKMDDSIEKKVEAIKKVKNVVVNVENIERLDLGTFLRISLSLISSNSKCIHSNLRRFHIQPGILKRGRKYGYIG